MKWEYGRKGKRKHLTKMTPLTCHILYRKTQETGGGGTSSLTDLLFSIEVVIIRTKRIVLPTVRQTPDWISFCYQVNHPITSHSCYL